MTSGGPQLSRAVSSTSTDSCGSEKTLYNEEALTLSKGEALAETLHALDTLKRSSTEQDAASRGLASFQSDLVFNPGTSIDMNLASEGRALLFTGKLLRESRWRGWSELLAILLDNYLVLAEPVEKNGELRYHVTRRPIPLELLELHSFTNPPFQRNTNVIQHVVMRITLVLGKHAVPIDAARGGAWPRTVYPLTLQHGDGGPYTLYAESKESREEWFLALEYAIEQRRTAVAQTPLFEVRMIAEDRFEAVGAVYDHESALTCSTTFMDIADKEFIAFGGASGVWIKPVTDDLPLHRVLSLHNVTQCSVLQELGVFLVLANKELYAYDVEALVPRSEEAPTIHNVHPQKLSGNKEVQYFSAARQNDQTLVISKKSKGTDSVFRVLKPVLNTDSGSLSPTSRASASLMGRQGFRLSSDWFMVDRDFYLPSETHDLLFLKTKVAIACTRGFEIMNLSDFHSVTIPHADPKDRSAKLAKRLQTARPLALFRSAGDEFLICYDKFGLYVDKHGNPSRGLSVITWEMPRAARVLFHAPYLVLFGTHFVEVRDIATGRAVQYIPFPAPGRVSPLSTATDGSGRLFGVYDGVRGLDAGKVRGTGVGVPNRRGEQRVFELRLASSSGGAGA